MVLRPRREGSAPRPPGSSAARQGASPGGSPRSVEPLFRISRAKCLGGTGQPGTESTPGKGVERRAEP